MEHAPDIVLKVSVNTCLSDVTTFTGKRELYTEFKVEGETGVGGQGSVNTIHSLQIVIPPSLNLEG